MKIGLVCPYVLNIGGVQEHVRALYENFTRRGHQVRILAPHLFGEKPKKDVIFLGRGFYTDNTAGTGSHLTLGLHYGPIVEEILQKEKFDILHFHEAMVPTISWFLLTYSQSINIATFHRAQKFSQDEASLYRFFKPVGMLLARRVHGYVAVSKTANKFSSVLFPGKCTIIPNGVDIFRFQPRGRKIKKFTDGKINILFVGRLEGRKGLMYLLRAFSQLETQNSRLVVVGDGPMRSEYEKFVKRRKIDHVSFEGEVSAADLPLYYRTADIFCSPAPYGESFGIVLLEAMASGLPLVAFANPGYKELLYDYPNRKLLPKPKDIDGLVFALKLLAQDQNLRRELGHFGREKAKEYAWKKVSGEILNFYRETLAKNKRRNGFLSQTLKSAPIPLPRFIKEFLANDVIGPY